MHPSLKSILANARRQIVLARMLWAGVLGLLAAAMLDGWRLMAQALPTRWLTAGMALAPTVVCVWLLVRPGTLRRAGPGGRVAIAGLCIVGGLFLATSAMMGAAWLGAWPAWRILLIPAIAMLAAICRPISLVELSRRLDHALGMKDRLSTAWETLGRSEQSTFTRQVQLQALTHLSDADLSALGLWAGMGKACAAAGIALLLWGVLPFVLPDGAGAQAGGADLARAIRDAARAAENSNDPRAVERLRALAELAGRLEASSADAAGPSPADLDDLIAAMRQALQNERLDSATREQLEATMERLEKPRLVASAGPSAHGPASRPTGAVVPSPPSLDRTIVFDPHYAGQAQGQSLASSPAVAALREQPYDQAWQQARQKASQALREEQIPPAYRQLVADYFSVHP